MFKTSPFQLMRRPRLVSLAQRLRSRFGPALLRLYFRPRTTEHLVRLGTAYGGWWVPTRVARPGAICYCAGAGEDISFDLALVAAGCQVTVFDPTPRAIAFVNSTPGVEVEFRFVDRGMWNEVTSLRFYGPLDSRHVSHSAVNLQRTSEYFSADVATVARFMEELGESHLDLIKLDIEGAEHVVLESMMADAVRPMVVCVEFDQPDPLSRTIASVGLLIREGYQLAKIDGWNYTFVRGLKEISDGK